MNLAELQSIRDTERSKDSLQSLDASFYEEVADYLAELRTERDRVAAEVSDPFGDPAISRLTDELKTGERTVEAIYERRVGKLVKLASFTAAGIPTDEEGLTVEEKALFDSVVEQIESNRHRVLETLLDPDGDGGADDSSVPTEETGTDVHEMASTSVQRDDAPPSDQPLSPDQPTEADVAPRASGSTTGEAPPADADAMDTVTADGKGTSNETGDGVPGDEQGGDSTPVTDEATGSSGPERTTVRITCDVGEIVGVDDRAYDLSTDDVVALPTENAGPLLERDAAEPLE